MELEQASEIPQILGKHPCPKQDCADKSDARIIQEFLRGDQEAVGILIERYQRRLYFFCLRMVGNHEDALEIVQKTFIQVIEKLNTLQKSSSFTTWMYRIAVNLCYNLLRERQIYEKVLMGLPPAEITYFDDPLEAEEKKSMVKKLLHSLSEKQRVAILLRVYENLSYQEIAEVLGCQEVTVRSHFHLGLKKLASQLKEIW